MDVQWAIVFDKLFKEIDGPKGSIFYYSGRDFLNELRVVEPNTPEYETFIAQRATSGFNTTRRAYFKDLFYGLDEEERIQFTLNVIADIEQKGHPLCEEIRRLVGYGTAGPEVIIPISTWNGERLNDFLTRIDGALIVGNEEEVLTLCYTCMEGFFKAYVMKNVPEQKKEKEITALAKIVKDDLKKKFPNYPGDVFNVITQSAHALNKIRDMFSDSHFGEEADRWAAMYARDLVNTHVRLLLHFM